MTDLSPASPPRRPEFRNINALTDLPGYRLPLAGWVSILHRISGALMFLMLPVIIWMFGASVSSEISYIRFMRMFEGGSGIALKLVALALIWAYLHHMIAGLRHLWMDVNHAVSKEFGRKSAAFTLVVSVTITLALAAKLFGIY
jgi:succinate dehydrogenase / fumarate reductase, cytochrome b subunit